MTAILADIFDMNECDPNVKVTVGLKLDGPREYSATVVVFSPEAQPPANKIEVLPDSTQADHVIVSPASVVAPASTTSCQ